WLARADFIQCEGESCFGNDRSQAGNGAGLLAASPVAAELRQRTGGSRPAVSPGRPAGGVCHPAGLGGGRRRPQGGGGFPALRTRLAGGAGEGERREAQGASGTTGTGGAIER